MRILAYENRKSDPVYYDISTPEKRDAAYLAIFKLLNEDWDVYCELAEFKPNAARVCEPCQKEIHRLCEKGNCSCENDSECERRTFRGRLMNTETIRQKAWYEAAKNGDCNATIKLLQARSGYKYEHVVEKDVTDATEAATGGGQWTPTKLLTQN